MLNVLLKYPDGWGQIALVKPDSAEHFLSQASGHRVIAVDDDGKVIVSTNSDDAGKRFNDI